MNRRVLRRSKWRRRWNNCAVIAPCAITLMTHFANADEARGVAEPLALFNDIAAPCRAAQRRIPPHCCVTLKRTATGASGLMHGASPFAEVSAQQLGLKPAMT